MGRRFGVIYASDSWRNGSGEGSSAEATSVYREWLQKFLYERSVRKIVDLGCGDWQFSKLIEWGNAEYRGIDVVPQVIDRNLALYGRPGVSFECADVAGFAGELPEADLILLKDVLQHWSHSAIGTFLPRLRNYRYSLITNSSRVGSFPVNSSIEDGGFSPIDLFVSPVSELIRRSGLEVREVLSYTAFGDDIKQVCLSERDLGD
jgi:SAM-dependent methyltransferase